MKKLIKLESSKNFLFVYWQLIDFCNFKCNYCSPFLYEGYNFVQKRNPTPSDNQILLFLESLSNIKKQKELHISLSGGEPTLHPLFPRIIETLEPISDFELITNGSRSLNWWKSLPQLPSLIRISLHPEFTEIKKVNELSEYILSKNVLLRFNLSMDPKNWDDSIKLYDSLNKDLKKYVRPKILHDWSNKLKPMKVYNENQISWIKDHLKITIDGSEESSLINYTAATYDNGHRGKLDFTHTSIYDNKYYNWKCSAGSSSISVNVLGEVYAGLCKQIKIGTIDNFRLLDDYLNCKSIICQCPADLLIPKYKD